MGAVQCLGKGACCGIMLARRAYQAVKKEPEAKYLTALPAVVLNMGLRGKRPPCNQQTFKTSALHAIIVKSNTTVNLLCTKPHNL